jgi:type VI secretion system secreted protein VgrG
MTMRDAFTIHSSALPGATQLAGFHGSEGLSRLYSFEILLLMTNDVGHDFNLESAVGAQATLRLDRSDGGPPCVINGVFAAIELVSDFATRSVFRAVLVPRLWHLTQSLHSRVFTQQTIPAILEAMLQSGGLSGEDYALRLLGSYALQEHVCQYQESDFDFISRWMEREGLYYYFEQGDGAERLIITDNSSSHKPLGVRPVRYFPQPAGTSNHGDAFRAFTCRHTSLPASVRLKDYDYAKPTFDVSGEAQVSPGGVGQISVHGARFFSPGEGARLAKVKAQGLQSGSVVYQGFGAAPSLRSGYTFDLEDHPRAAFNTSYLTTELEHWNNQLPGVPECKELMPWDDWYRVEVTAVAATVQYRAPQRTAWPRIYGTEHAVIDGPATSDYAQIDSHGRYAVKFHFDESDLGGGKASTWVRMLQPHGGGIEGFHFPLRAGTEVMCTFAGGDPDRPSIVGVAPNALTPSPVNAGNNSRNVIQTGGRNRLELEDKSGKERITLSTPHTNTYIRMGAPNDDHNFHIHTDGNAINQIGGKLQIEVDGNLEEYVKGTTTETYQGVADTVYKDAVTVKSETTKSETVVGDLTENFNANMTQTVGQKLFQKIGVPSGTAPTFDAASVHTQEIYGNVEVKIDGTYKRTAHKSNETYKGDFSKVTTGSEHNTVYGALTSEVHGLRNNITFGNVFTEIGGFQETLIQGGSFSNVLGLNIATSLIGAINAVGGVRVNATAGPQFNFNFGATTSVVNGLVSSNVIGAKFETISGIKAEFVGGFSVKHEVGKLETAEMAAKNYSMHVRTQQLEIARAALGVQANDLLAVV